MFTVPHDGDGLYYFSVYVVGDAGELGIFAMHLNDDVICTTYPNHDDNGALDYAPGSCSAVVEVVAGNMDFKFIIQF